MLRTFKDDENNNTPNITPANSENVLLQPVGNGRNKFLGMQSFDSHPNGDQAPLTGLETGPTTKEQKKSRFIKGVAIFIVCLLVWRLFAFLLLSRGPAQHEEGEAEEELMEAWQKAMQEAHEQAEPQYRLIPTDMIPGLPPGGWVRVRVAGAASQGDGGGDHGETGGMERDDKPDMLTVKAHLPGHHMLEEKKTFDADENTQDYDESHGEVNPLDVKLIERTLLIRGTMRKPMPHMGDGVFMQSSFQRAVWLPANSKPEDIYCEYGRTSGNLLIKIPKDINKSEKDDLDEDHPVEDMQRMEKIRSSFEDFQRRVRAMQSQQREGVRGPGAVHGVGYADLAERLNTMHKEGDGPTLEKTNPHVNAISRDSVEYLGCFRSWDLPKHKKLLPGHHASSFSSAVVQAVKDAKADETPNLEDEESQYFFALARHDAPHPTGAAFTFRRFDHDIDNQHGVMCGNHCDDDGTWFCGALGDAEHHSDLAAEDGVSGALFAVYALKNPKDIKTADLEAAETAAKAADAKSQSEDHPQWKLVDDFNGGDSKVEIIVPKASESVEHDGKTAVFKDYYGEQTAKISIPVSFQPKNCQFGEPYENSQDRVVTCQVGDNVIKTLTVHVRNEL